MSDLIENIREKCDPDELIEVLGLDTEELVYILYEYIREQKDKFDYLEDD